MRIQSRSSLLIVVCITLSACTKPLGERQTEVSANAVEPAADQTEPGLSPPPPDDYQRRVLSAAECEKSAQRLEQWAKGEPVSHDPSMNGLDDWLAWPMVDLPVAGSHYRQLDAPGGEVVIFGDGTLAYPSGYAREKKFPNADFKTHLPLILQAVAGAKRILILAEGSVPAASVRELVVKLPKHEVGLAVSKSPATFVAEHKKLVPNAPAWLHERLVDHLTRKEPSLPYLVPLIANSAGRCPDVIGAFQLIKGGAGLDMVGTALAAALRKCKCDNIDVDVLEALTAFILSPIPTKYAWVPLPKANASMWQTLPAPVSVEQVVRALTDKP